MNGKRVKLSIAMLGVGSGLLFGGTVAVPHHLQIVQAATVPSNAKIDPIHVGDQVVQGSGPAKSHLSINYQSGVLRSDIGVETDANGHWTIKVNGNETFSGPLKAGDTFSVNGQTTVVTAESAKSTDQSKVQGPQPVKLAAAKPGDQQISGTATPNSELTLYLEGQGLNLTKGKIKTDQNGHFKISMSDLKADMQVSELNELAKGTTIMMVDSDQSHQLSPIDRASFQIVGQNSQPAPVKTLTLDQPVAFPKSNGFSGTGIAGHQIKVYHQSNSGLDHVYMANVDSQGRWSLDIADQADDDASTVRSGDLVIASDGANYTAASVSSDAKKVDPATQHTQERLIVALTNGAPANYGKPLTIRVLDQGKVIATKTLPATKSEEPSQDTSGVTLSNDDHLVKGHTYELQVWVGNQQEKPDPTQFKFGDQASLDVTVDAQAYQVGSRRFQLIDSQTKKPIQAKTLAVPNLTSKKGTVTKTTDPSGVVTFSTNDQNFLRGTIYHIEVPGYQVVGGVNNWNLIGGEADQTPTKIELKKLANDDSSHQKTTVPTTTSGTSSSASNSTDSASSTSSAVASSETSSATASNSSSDLSSATSTKNASLKKTPTVRTKAKHSKTTIRVKSRKVIHSKAMFKIKHFVNVYRDGTLKKVAKKTAKTSLKGWKVVEREVIVKNGRQANYYQLKNKQGQKVWVSQHNLKVQK